MNPKTLEALGPLAGGLFGLIDDLFTSEEERAEARLRLTALLSAEKMKQMEVNAAEAQHKSLFVAGWRPAVGWICASALAWQFLLLPMFMAVVSTIAAATGVSPDFSGLIQADLATLMPVLLGMLGIGAMRTYEKSQGVASNSLGGK